MKCTDHNRAHCREPHCHVLAVCSAEVPVKRTGSWCWRRGYTKHPAHLNADSREIALRWIAPAIATRLIAWMRWDGAQSCEACEGTGVRPYHGLGSCENCGGSRRVPGYHPLDTVMSHADRVAALGRVCRKCMTERARNGAILARMYDDGLLPPEMLRVWPSEQCTHDGINWATGAALLDRMEEHGIGLGVVHEWRPPLVDAKPQEPGSLWTDQHFQAMAQRYPFSWTDIRAAATVWREWLGVEIPRDTLETICAMAARSNMLPVTYADATARLEIESRASSLNASPEQEPLPRRR